jgi:hypothetical protein
MIAPEHRVDMGDHFVADRQVRNSGQEHLRVNNLCSQRLSSVVPVAFPPGCTFRKDEVVHLEAPGDNGFLRTRSRGHLGLHQSLLPTPRSLCGVRPDAVGVVAVGHVER